MSKHFGTFAHCCDPDLPKTRDDVLVKCKQGCKPETKYQTVFLTTKRKNTIKCSGMCMKDYLRDGRKIH